jgi:steroid delta-isomerase-like uncharacterized protein
MSTEQNKATIRRFYKEAFGKGNVDIMDEVLADDFVAHAPAEPGHDAETQSRERLKEEITRNRAAFPDLTFNLEDMIAEGDTVAIRWTATGTHEGPLMDLPPTGKQVTLKGMNFLRFEDGKIAEDWVIWDSMSMMQQLGIGPDGPGGPQE